MSDRAASEVLSFALVFGLVVTSVAVVSVTGLDALQSARDAERMNNAERAFDVLSDNLADVHQRGAPSRATEVSIGNSQLATGTNVTINVTLDPVGAPTRPPNVTEVRPIVYSGNQERTLVYEGGAMFRTDRDGGLVLEEPPFVAGGDRLVVPIVATQSKNVESAGGSTVLLRATERRSDVQVTDSDGSYDAVYVNVSSPRNELWKRYFESKADGNADVAVLPTNDDHATLEVTNPDHVVVVVHEINVEIER